MVELPTEKCSVGMVLDCPVRDRHGVPIFDTGHVIREHNLPTLLSNHVRVVAIRDDDMHTYLLLPDHLRDAVESRVEKVFAPNKGNHHPLIDMLLRAKREELALQVKEAGRIPWVVLP